MDKYYDSIVSGYSELYGIEQLKKMEIIKDYIDKEIKLLNNYEQLLIDIGCGTGLSTSMIEVPCVGLDPSMDSLNSANQTRLEKTGVTNFQFEPTITESINHLGYICGIAEALPFKTDCCKISISITAVHNFSDIEMGLKEIKRITSHRAVITVLKKAKRYSDIILLIKKYFQIHEIVDSEVDSIFYLIPR